MTSAQVEIALVNHFQQCGALCFPRCNALTYECDLMLVRRSMWAEEIETKVSRSDFKRDFTKKHKHMVLCGELPPYRYMRYVSKFSFAVPVEMREFAIANTPAYAGLIVVDGRRIEIIKPAPRLPGREKVDLHHMVRIAASLEGKYWGGIRKQIEPKPETKKETVEDYQSSIAWLLELGQPAA